MNYLLNKKVRRKKYTNIAFGVVVLFFLIYFRTGIFRGFSYIAQIVFHPVLILGNNIGGKIHNLSSYFYSKSALLSENENLKAQIAESQADRANYASVLDENTKMKEILDRKNNNNTDLILAGILAKPNRSIYDTLLIDAGTNDGILKEKKVFALGNVPIGYIAETYPSSSKVVLYSNPGEKTDVVISGKDIYMQAVGRGGGNFEMILPRDFIITEGEEVDLPGVNPYILGTVQTILSDPRDSFQKALLVSPVNVQQLKFVEVEK